MRAVALSLVALLTAWSAGAQFVQYTAPGSLAEEQIPTKERLRTAMEEARYRLGPLVFGPWLALKDVAYVDNVYFTETNKKFDLTATIGVGAHAYLPIGPRMTLGMYALPEYVWWRDLSNRRGWNGAVGTGLFGYFNRITVEVEAGGSRHQQYASSEVEVPVNMEDRRVSAVVEVQVAGKLSLFGRGRVDQWRYTQRGLTTDLENRLILLDRDERSSGGGARFHFTKDTSLGLGAEQVINDFIHPERDRSNSGTAPLAELSLKGGHVRLTASAVFLDLKPRNGSGFVAYKGTTGHFRVAWQPAGKLEMQCYGGRDLAYSIEPATSHYLDERTGIALQSALGWRAVGRVFIEAGHDSYVSEPGAAPGRTEDLKAYGATVNLRLTRRATVVLGGDRTDYTSSDGIYDRSVTRVQTSIQVTGGKSQWW